MSPFPRSLSAAHRAPASAMTFLRLRPLSLVLAFALAACGGAEADDPEDVPPAADAEVPADPQEATPLSLSRNSAEPAGTNCPYGGTKIESGLDWDGDGVLSDGEVTGVRYECSDEDGTCRLSDGAIALACGAKECGSVTVTDSCGQAVQASCGSCGGGICLEDVAICCTPLTSAAAYERYCGQAPNFWNCGAPFFVDDLCGGTVQVDCSDGGECGEGLVCNEDEASPTWHQCVKRNCTPKKETDSEFCQRNKPGARCGSLVGTDTCGGRKLVEDCGVCGQPKSCSEADNTCSCTPLTCAGEGITCGELYDGCGSYIRCGGACVSGESLTLRLLTGNLTSGNLSTYEPGHGIRIFQGLKPQIAAIQEFKYGDNSYADLRRMVMRAFGDRFYQYVEPKTSGSTIPNGIVSYYPFKSQGMLDDRNIGNRHHVWAQIDIPGDKDLWLFSVHLSTVYGDRQSSMEELTANIREMGIPSGDYVVIAGDFNTGDFSDAALTLLKKSGLVAMDSAKDCPIDQAGKHGTNAKRGNPYDGIYTSQALKNLRTQVVLGEAEDLTERGLVFDSRVFTPLSAVPPVQQGDSGADNMQHMAVIKDFRIAR